MDNHFSGNNVIKYIGELGGRGTWTTARGRLPEGIPKKYLQCKKEVMINARSKAARYENPVVAVKHVISQREARKGHIVWCTYPFSPRALLT